MNAIEHAVAEPTEYTLVVEVLLGGKSLEGSAIGTQVSKDVHHSVHDGGHVWLLLPPPGFGG